MVATVSEVIIVGAGPVGLLTALALAQVGVSVTVLEAEAEPSAAPRAMVYFASTLLALEELGILPDVAAVALKGTSFGHYVPDFGFRAEISNRAMTGITFDYQLHCGQDQIARIALANAVALGVDVRFGHRVAALTQDADGVALEVATGDGSRDLRAQWVIGADGARSTVRRLLDLDFEGDTWSNRFIATNVYCDFGKHGYAPANFVCDPVYAAVVAVIDTKGLWRVTYQESADLPVESYLERLPERYAHILPPGERFEIAASSPYAIHQRAATQFRVGRVLLAGDAAHATNPCGGLGLTGGLWDGMILADLLGAVRRGEAEENVLDRYAEERRRIFWEITSPGATQNKRIMEEADPARRAQDMAAVQAAAANPDIARLMLGYPFRLIGDTIRPGSRWAQADPTGAAGIDIAGRASQLV